MARIKDIAARAGVSVGTVDRVIHSRGSVAKEVEKKVKEAIEELGYKPNLAARSLAKRTDHRIAVVLPQHTKDEFWGNQTQGILRALDSCKNFGLRGDILSFNDQKKGELLKLTDSIFDGSYEALLIAPTVTGEATELMDRCESSGMPYVQINSFIERDGDSSLGYVGQDSYRSGQLGAKLLDFGISKGDQLGLLHMEYDVENSNHLVDKEAGFRNYLQHHGHHYTIYKRLSDIEDLKKIRYQINELLEEQPKLKGLFITTSRVHLICETLRMLNRDDIALVGFDIVKENIRALHNYKKLFLINQNPSLQGFYGVMRLFDHFLKNKSVTETMHLPLDIVTLENVSNHQYMQDRDNIALDKNEYD